jgi:DMSO/TMAO reductase YedYZ molybdopterin-dependent catalytic subunit/glyoxylase-like metal-dependent hydrolase (beta-lactamase superfamily II)
MIFTQHYLGCLSHASYLIGDETTGRAVVIDPRRDVGVYVEEAAANGLSIERVIETHVHADFVGGHLELAAQTGALISYGEGADFEFAVDHLHDGQRLSLGEITFEVLATPGHTPESICIVVYEHPDDQVPYGVLTGDTLFVGDVGRPDLASSAGLSADVLGRRLYHSLHEKLLTLPDETRVFPAHGAGSSCGKQLSSETSSTLGEQRRTNYALQPMDEETFVAVVTEGQPARPAYFEFDALQNRQLHPLLDDTAPPLIGIDEALASVEGGALLLDVREPADFAAGHLRGAVNVGLQSRFAEWAGDVVAPERDIVLVGDPASAVEAKVRLGRVGIDTVVGQLDDPAGVLADRPELHESSSRLTIEQLAELRGLDPNLQLIDVRSPGETANGTLAGAREIPLAVLTSSLAAIDPAAAVVVYCGSGNRSLVAASVLREAGVADVSDLLGGSAAWEGAGLPVARGTPTSTDLPEVGAGGAKAMLEAGAVLLDVREPDEWHAGHAPEAWLVPMGQVRSRRAELPADRPLVVVCRSGGRSAAVTASLRAWGFDACNLAGGMSAWAASGLAVTTPEADETGLVVHSRQPLNCETSLPALIGGVVMPNARFYVRNHFPTPTLDPATWCLDVGGLVERPLQLSLRDLRQMRSHTLGATLECAGNGRSTFDPPIEGEQWRFGAVSTAEWTGVPLVEVLDRVSPTTGAVDVLFRGADRGPAEGSTEPTAFERSLSIADARHSDALLAYAMNGETLPVEHGYPLRLIVPGWYAVASVKWLTEIEVIGAAFEGFFQTQRYVFEQESSAPAREPVRLQRVRSLITEPTGEEDVSVGDLVVRGVAWSGEAPIERVEVRIADGPWRTARLIGERRPYCWQWWEQVATIDTPGVTTVTARATDLAGRTQPESSEWNRLGYGGNGYHVVSLRVR